MLEMGYLPRRAADWDWNGAKRENCVAVNKAGAVGVPKSLLTLGRRCGVCHLPAGVWICFDPGSPHRAPFPPFLEFNVYTVTLYV